MRELYFDYIKGVAIIAVICIHSGRIAEFAPGSLQLESNLALRQIVNFAVPTFLALAGYFDGRSNARSVAARLWRLMPPYIVWTLVFIVLTKPTHLLRPADLMVDLLTGEGIGIGYFVIVLAQMTIVMSLLERASISIQAIAAIVMFAFGTAFTYADAFLGLWPRLVFPFNTLIFIVWCPFYQFGFMIARSGELRRRMAEAPLPPLLAVLVILLCLALSEAMSTQYMDKTFAASQLKLSNKMEALAVIVVIFSLRDKVSVKDGMVAWLGRNSYFIYLSHMLPMLVAVKIATAFPVTAPEFSVIFAKAGFVLAACCCAAWAARRLTPRDVQRYIIG